MAWRVGIDIGGTFTDFALQDEETGELVIGKLFTTPRDPSVAVLSGINDLLRGKGISLSDVSQILHGTTLASNLIIERKGGKTGLIVTKGFGDILEIRRQKRWDLYDLTVEKPKSLVPRWHVYEVTERLAYDGSVVTPLANEEVREVARKLVEHGVASVAVCLLHSHRNDEHERLVGEILAEEAPGVLVSLSSEVSPVWREYERANTTVANAYVMTAVREYQTCMQEQLRDGGHKGELFVMQSSGGLAMARVAEKFPVRLIESGPAAGALAAGFYGELMGYGDLICFDMGGTTAKACVVENGSPATKGELEVDRIDLKPGSGITLTIPSVDMIEVGAGGGSISRIRVGVISVGPDSAGADPGPACYGLGGTEPTVTDANVVLGYVNPDFFAGGSIKLDRDASYRAIDERIARPLGIDVTEAAWGIHEIVNLNMENATRAVTLERGYDPRMFTFMAFGGAGPAHGARVARNLGCPRILFPASAGVTSAIGLLVADVRFDLARTVFLRLEDGRVVETIDDIYQEMEVEAASLLAESDVGSELRIVRTVDMRYSGQGTEVTVPVPDGRLTADHFEKIKQAFHDAYFRGFGYSNIDELIEAVTWRLAAYGVAPKPRLKKFERTASGVEEALKEKRKVYFPECGRYVECDIYDRYKLFPGGVIKGPAVVEERESTTVILPDDEGTVDDWGNLMVTIGS